jgi:hypothetical protein
VTAGQTFRIIVQVPPGYGSGIRLAVRRISHQAAAKYESDVIFNNRRPGDISNEDDVIEHPIKTDEGWLPVAAVGHPLDTASERYVVGLDSGFQEMNVVTVTGGADGAALASVIDGNLDTLQKAVTDWKQLRTMPIVADLHVVEIDKATPSTPDDRGDFLLWSPGSPDGKPSSKAHHYVVKEAPGRNPVDLAASQKGALVISTRELEKALGYLPKNSVGIRAAELERLKEVLGSDTPSK